MYEYYVELKLPTYLQELVDKYDDNDKEFLITKRGVFSLFLRAWSKNQIKSMFDRCHEIERIEYVRTLE